MLLTLIPRSACTQAMKTAYEKKTCEIKTCEKKCSKRLNVARLLAGQAEFAALLLVWVLNVPQSGRTGLLRPADT